ncbi:MAG TPA: hypothetical protein VGE35_01340 [Candidatus Paceibacterota bacterium]
MTIPALTQTITQAAQGRFLESDRRKAFEEHLAQLERETCIQSVPDGQEGIRFGTWHGSESGASIGVQTDFDAGTTTLMTLEEGTALGMTL